MPAGDPASELNARLERLEETVLFAERTGEQLSESLTDLSRRVEALTQRLARLEERLGHVEEQASQAPEDSPDENDASGAP